MKLSFIVFYLMCNNVFAQPSPIINTIKEYDATVSVSSKNKLVNLARIPLINIELKYATKDNFTHKKLYKNAATTFLRIDAADALYKLQLYLNELGYGLKIFDAYRPYSVTKLMWALIGDEKYVANPKNGSGHNKGTSVDLTIITLSNKMVLDMGTSFDDFTEKAHHTFTNNFDSSVIKNRILLKTTMEKFGFKSLETEWWHYSWQSAEKYDLLNLSFKKLNKTVKP